jgi:3',5'-cyclic-AMP phosphodiesterase
MRIAQISDVHVGSLFQQSIFDTLVDELNTQLKPDVLIISGDLTDDGLVFQFEKAQKEIQRFDCPNLIVIPGNHDFRHTGYLLFKKYFPMSAKRVHEFRDGNIVIVTVNSVRPDKDEGQIGHRQILWLENTVGKFSEHLSDRKTQRLKIVCMHHHLIAIPDTGYTDLVGISDAGDALQACLESGVDVVICGHKHRPWMWNLGRLLILYAGTASSWRYRGIFQNTYNILDIKNNKVQADIKVVGGKRIPLSEIVQRFKEEARTKVLSG